MASKSFLFYSPTCGNCNKLLSSVKGTTLESTFIYIDIHTAKRLPKTLKGVPAILPSHQPETSILQGRYAFSWVQKMLGQSQMGNPRPKPSESSHGPQNSRSYAKEPSYKVVDSTGNPAEQKPKDFLGNNPFEMGNRGYSDRYSFLDDDSGMSHRYTYVNGKRGPGRIGASVTHEPGEALKDVKGVSQKTKQLNHDLKRLQEERDTFGKGVQRV